MKIYIKKYIPIIAIGATIFLAGCGSSGQNMSFQDAYNKLSQQKIIHVENNTPNNTPIHDQTTVDFTVTSPQGFMATGTLIASGEYDMSSGAANIDLSLIAKAFEPSFGATVNVAGLVKVINDTQSTYAYINNMSVTPETGNADGGILTALLGSISQKWINLSDDWSTDGTTVSGSTATGWATNNGLSSYHASFTHLLTRIQEGIATYPLLKETGKTEVDGKLAYNIDWNAEWVSGFVNYLLQDTKNFGNNITFSGSTLEEVVKGILESPIVGQIVVYSEDNVVLRIDSIQTKDAGIISLRYSTKEGLTWTNIDTANTVIATGDILSDGDEVMFHINIPTNNMRLSGETKEDQTQLSLTLTTTDITAMALIKNVTTVIQSFTPTVVTWAMPLEEVTRWFSMLGLTTDTVQMPTTTDEMGQK